MVSISSRLHRCKNSCKNSKGRYARSSPLSPLLFVIVMEALACQMHRAANRALT